MKKFLALAAASILAMTTLLSGCGSETGKIVGGVEDLPGARIGVQLGTTGDIYASDYEAEGSTIERYPKGADAVMGLKQGKLDCVIIDEQPAKKFVEVNDDLTIYTELPEIPDIKKRNLVVVKIQVQEPAEAPESDSE